MNEFILRISITYISNNGPLRYSDKLRGSFYKRQMSGQSVPGYTSSLGDTRQSNSSPASGKFFIAFTFVYTRFTERYLYFWMFLMKIFTHGESVLVAVTTALRGMFPKSRPCGPEYLQNNSHTDHCCGETDQNLLLTSCPSVGPAQDHFVLNYFVGSCLGLWITVFPFLYFAILTFR